MMRKRYWGILTLAALTPALAAASQFQHSSAAICVSSYSTNSNAVMRGPNLINWDTNGTTVACALPFQATSVNPITVNPALGRVDYMDFNGTSGFFGPGAVSCQMSMVTATNTIVNSSWLYSCSTPGGCASGDNTFTGYSYLSFPDTFASTANVVGLSIQCGIPGYDSVNGVSGLTGVAVSTSTP